MRRADGITDEGTSYLWHRRIANSSINVIFSRPGMGKSTAAADMAARVTTGTSWPDGSPCDMGGVLYLRGEGTDAAIRDRLKAAGADLSRVNVIARTDDADKPMIDLALDGDALCDALGHTLSPKLIILDTLDSLFPSMRMIDNAHIRQCLFPVQEIAETYKIAVVAFAHTNKGGYSDPLDRLSGGRAIGGAARSVWYLGKLDPTEKTVYMASVKCNDFVPAKTIEYQIVGSTVDSPGRTQWGKQSDVSAWELDRPRESKKADKSSECAEWLANRLNKGPQKASKINSERTRLGYGDYVWKKARNIAEVESVPAKGSAPAVYWYCLPDQTPPKTENQIEITL